MEWTITITLNTDDDTAEDIRDRILDMLDQDSRPLTADFDHMVIATNENGQVLA